MSTDRRLQERQRAARLAVGQTIRRARQDEGVSIRRLGDAVGIDASHLSRVERGEHALSQDALVAVAEALGRDVSLRLYEERGIGRDEAVSLAGGSEPWPGPAILWVSVEGGRGRVLDALPRALKRAAAG